MGRNDEKGFRDVKRGTAPEHQNTHVTLASRQSPCIAPLCDYLALWVSQLLSYVRRTLKDLCLIVFVPPQHIAQSLVPFVLAIWEVNLDYLSEGTSARLVHVNKEPVSFTAWQRCHKVTHSGHR